MKIVKLENKILQTHSVFWFNVPWFFLFLHNVDSNACQSLAYADYIVWKKEEGFIFIFVYKEMYPGYRKTRFAVCSSNQGNILSAGGFLNDLLML